MLSVLVSDTDGCGILLGLGYVIRDDFVICHCDTGLLVLYHVANKLFLHCASFIISNVFLNL